MNLLYVLGKLPYALLALWTSLCALALFVDIQALKTALVFLSALSPLILYAAFTFVPNVRAIFWIVNTFSGWIRPVYFDALDHILKNAKQGDPKSVVQEWDKFCWTRYFMMNIGDVKGEIADKALKDCNPTVAVELGSHCGYSTIRFAQHLKPGATLYSVDPDPIGQAVSAKLIAFSGVGDKVSQHYGYSNEFLKKMAGEGKVIDFLLLDHVKELYLSDVQLAISLGLFREGTVVVADNVQTPGAPEYKQWILKQKFFRTQVHNTFIEYSKTTPDQVFVSVFLGFKQQ